VRWAAARFYKDLAKTCIGLSFSPSHALQGDPAKGVTIATARVDQRGKGSVLRWCGCPKVEKDKREGDVVLMPMHGMAEPLPPSTRASKRR
jgi:hypothetical protein